MCLQFATAPIWVQVYQAPEYGIPVDSQLVEVELDSKQNQGQGAMTAPE